MNTLFFKEKRIYFALLSIVILSILMRLPVLGWYTGDSGVLSLYTRSMYEQLHNINYRYPNYVTQAQKEYPPLYFYMIVAFYFLFGVSYLSGCLVTFLFSVLTVIAVFYLGKIMYDGRTGLISAFILSILPWHIIYGSIVMIDPVAAFFITITFIAFWQALQKGQWTNYILFGVLLGASFNTKTYNLMFIPLFISYFILHHLFWKNKNDTAKEVTDTSVILRFSISLIISLCIIAPWFLTVGLNQFTYSSLNLKLPPSYKVDPLFGIEFLIVEFKFFFLFFLLGIIKIFDEREKQGLLLLLWFLIPVSGFTLLAYSFRILHAVWNFPRYTLMVAPVVCVLSTSGLNYISKIIYAIDVLPSKISALLVSLRARNRWFEVLLKKRNIAMLTTFSLLIFSSVLITYRYASRLNIGHVYFGGTNVISDKEYVVEMMSHYINSNLPEGSIIIASHSDIYWILKYYSWPPMEIRSKDDISSLIKSQEIHEFFYVTYDDRDVENVLLKKPLEVNLMFLTVDPDYAHIKCYLYRCNTIG